MLGEERNASPKENHGELAGQKPALPNRKDALNTPINHVENTENNKMSNPTQSKSNGMTMNSKIRAGTSPAIAAEKSQNSSQNQSTNGTLITEGKATDENPMVGAQRRLDLG